MKSSLRLMSLILLSLAAGCAQQTQPPQNAQQSKAAQTQGQTPTPAATSPPATTERGTPAEARAMLEQAAAHYNEVGRKQALADFTGKRAPFAARDLYVVCIGPNRIETANGGFPQYVGASADLLKDADGKSLGKAIWEAAARAGSGSVEYRWVNPVNGKVEPKVLFFQKVGEDICGVGVYNPQ